MKKKGIIIFVVCVLLIPAHGFYTCGQGTNNEYVELKKNSTIYEAYTLFSPLQSKVTYLINNSFEVVHTWNSQYNPGNSVYLLENGNLFRTAFLVPNANKKFQAGGMGGCVEEIDWEGNVVWDFTYSSDQYLLHHDIEKLPNGNILMIAWEYKSSEEAITAGRNPELLRDNELWPDHIIEIQPTGSQGGEIVWEWHIWDHLIQDYDRAKENYGVVSKHPELIDLNYIGSRGPEAKGADWNHINSIDYNEEFDQILLSVHGFNEIWIIDHS
ncbi:MAG: aryl-sulfate sulfotransferase, partial [Desulfovibrionales bacterium]|nr:aryl-sulfate sulfotransferase [Desulfovibrionales bacterium]